MKVGLVLEGGAMRGLYTAGVLDTFLDNGIKADTVIGTSAGVLFGVNFASGQRGRALRYNKKYAPKGCYMGLRSLLTTGNIINRQFAYYDLPSRLDVFDEEAYENSGIDFYATVTNVETGEAEYIKISDCFGQMEVMRATSAMPFVSRIVEYDGKKYLDGGIADSIPVDKAVEMGCEKIIAVLTRPLEYRKGKTNSRLAELMYGKKYPKAAARINSRPDEYNACVEKIIGMEKRGEIFVIRPSRTVKVRHIERDTDKLQEIYDLGAADCAGKMEQLKKYLVSPRKVSD
ncbi:MAG: patatin family protein [Clostridia bacterium]|nr:patatin family protein [Clostridia bacterium]